MVGPSMPEAEKVAAVREALPASGAGIYLNAPIAGPFPAESAAAMAEIAEWELRTGRANRDRAEDVASRVDEARAAIAAILTVDLSDVVLAHGIDDAIGRAVRSIRLQAGDLVAVDPDPALAAVADHLPAGVAAVPLEGTELPPGPLRLVALPLVRSTTGERVPVEELSADAHRRGASTLVEASLAVGAVPVDPASVGADLLVARSETWLLGPEGLAIVAGRGVPGAEWGFHLPSIVGFARGAGWLSMYVGLPWIHDRGAMLTALAARRLAAIEGVELLTPAAHATTLVFRIRGWAPNEALEELGARVFLLASVVEPLGAIRVGIGFWNTADELDRLAHGVALLAAHTPDSLPRRPRLAMLGES